MKKIISLLLAIIMAALFVTTAFAAQTLYINTHGPLTYDDDREDWPVVGRVAVIGALDANINERTYVVDTNSTLRFECEIGGLFITDCKPMDFATSFFSSHTGYTSPECTVKYAKGTYAHPYYGDSREYIKYGAEVKFNKIGEYSITYEEGTRSDGFHRFDQYLKIKVVAPGSVSEKKYIHATKTASPIFINGEERSFDAYNIGGNNYFKLREVAYKLDGTEKNFEVVWNSEKNAIELFSGKPYTRTGDESLSSYEDIGYALETASKIYKDGVLIALKAYNINGNNYFKLRDLGQAFDFDVSWDNVKKQIIIETDKSYTAD